MVVDIAGRHGQHFDVIVVGAGPAGATAAYKLARAGFKTLLLERGRGAGSKQVCGCRVYAGPLHEVFPDLEKAPVQRWVAREKASIVSGERMASIEYETRARYSFTTYLPEFTAWIVGKAVEAGAVFVDEVRVDRLVVEGGKIVGVESGSDRVYADIVVDAEGVNRLLLERLGLVEKPRPRHVALGVKEVVRVGEKTLEERFGLSPGMGLAWILLGEVTGYMPGGAFIYTNRDTVSIGIVLYLDTAVKQLREHVTTLLEKLRLHPLLKNYWAGGEVVEYSAHLVVEHMLEYAPRKLATNGLLVAGDAAGLLVNTGYTFRGVDYAVYSGYMAAKAVEDAHREGVYSEEVLRRLYEDKLKKSFMYRDIRRHRGAGKAMEKPLLFDKYVRTGVDFARRLYELDKETPGILEALHGAFRENRLGLIGTIATLYRLVRRL